MIALSIAKLTMFFAANQNFSLNKAKKKKTFSWKVWINADKDKFGSMPTR